MGRNLAGQLGDGSNTDRLNPVQLGITNVSSLAGGKYSSYFETVKLWSVGGNTVGQLGDGMTRPKYPYSGSGRSEFFFAGQSHLLLTKSDRSLWARTNGNGKLGWDHYGSSYTCSNINRCTDESEG